MASRKKRVKKRSKTPARAGVLRSKPNKKRGTSARKKNVRARKSVKRPIRLRSNKRANRTSKRPARKRKVAPARKSNKARDRARALAQLQQENRALKETIRDITRTPKQKAQGSRGAGAPREEDEEGGGEVFIVPRGARVTERNDDGEPIAFELPTYTGAEFQDIDWGDFDWDDIYDDVGDEDEDSYGEDAT